MPVYNRKVLDVDVVGLINCCDGPFLTYGFTSAERLYCISCPGFEDLARGEFDHFSDNGAVQH